MKTSFPVYLLIIVFSLLSNSGKSQQIENSLFWRISGNGLQEPSFVFGTIHLICQDDFVEFPLLAEKMDSTRLLVLELDLEDPMIMLAMMQDMIMPDNQTISELLEEEQYRMITDFFRDTLGIDPNQFSQVKPFYLYSMLIPHMMDCETQSYDMYLLEKAKRRDIPLKGLESVREQIAVFNVLSLEEQAQMLYDAVQNYRNDRQDLQDMVGAYVNEDIEALRQHSLKIEGKHESFSFAIMEERNLNWIPRMKALMHDMPVFFGVGAAHLPGQVGIVNLLRKEGYIVEPLR
jgi:uncharacterized protein